MKKFCRDRITAFIVATVLLPGLASAEPFKMLAPSSGQQMFYGSATLGNGSATVSVLPGGTVTAATATLNSDFTTGTATPRLAVTKSGGSITIQAYDEGGVNTTSSAKVFYTGGGSK